MGTQSRVPALPSQGTSGEGRGTITPPRIYFAGKIAKHDWRASILGDMPDEQYEERTKREAQGLLRVRQQEIDQRPFVYTGPWFVCCDHGCAHGDDQHGVVGGACEPAPIADEDSPAHMEVLRSCLAGIDACQVVFAWIDDVTAYGTMAELGYARCQQKIILIAGPRWHHDLWFVYALADRVMFGYHTARSAFVAALPTIAPVPRAPRVKIPSGLRFEILRRDDYRCQLCGARAGAGVQLHIDHRVALASGGTNEKDNLWTLCAACNLGKGARPLALDDGSFIDFDEV